MSERWVLDTNVVVSALLFRGRASALHAAWKAGAFRLVASAEIVAEYQRVLAYPKFRLTPEQAVALYDQEVRPYVDIVPQVAGEALTPDPDDDKFVWVAESAAVPVLVSGDPHVLVLRPAWRGVAVLTHIPRVQTTRIRHLSVGGVQNTASDTPRYPRICAAVGGTFLVARCHTPSRRRRSACIPPKCSMAISAVRFPTGRFVKGCMIFSSAARAALRMPNCQ